MQFTPPLKYVGDTIYLYMERCPRFSIYPFNYIYIQFGVPWPIWQPYVVLCAVAANHDGRSNVTRLGDMPNLDVFKPH